MPNESKISKLILHLTKATIDKDIEWEREDPPRCLTRATDEIVTLYLETEYKDQIIALAEYRYQSYDGDHDLMYWTGTSAIAMLDDARELLWEHRSNTSALENLIRVARDAATGIDDIIDSIIN